MSLCVEILKQVINDYEQVGDAVEDSSAQPENIYENIIDEPMYENIYEKVMWVFKYAYTTVLTVLSPFDRTTRIIMICIIILISSWFLVSVLQMDQILYTVLVTW